MPALRPSRLTLALAGLLALAARADHAPPDSRDLLRAAERARPRIERGRMELDVTGASPLAGPVRRRVEAAFDGERCRNDEVNRTLGVDWIRDEPTDHPEFATRATDSIAIAAKAAP